MRMKAWMLAGLGLALAGATGCWDAQKRPNYGPLNIPKTPTNPAGNMNGSGMPGANNTQPGGRVTGSNSLVDPTTGRVVPAGGPMASPGFGAPAGGGSPTGIQPIATSVPGSRGVQPAVRVEPNDVPAPDKLPIDLTSGGSPALPAVPPISTQNQDPKRNFSRGQPPAMPGDTLAPPPSDLYKALPSGGSKLGPLAPLP